jgi:hypothetical protein
VLWKANKQTNKKTIGRKDEEAELEAVSCHFKSRGQGLLKVTLDQRLSTKSTGREAEATWPSGEEHPGRAGKHPGFWLEQSGPSEGIL